MPWWERRMWIEKINEEFAPPASQGAPGDGADSDSDVEVYDDVTDFGITPRSLA